MIANIGQAIAAYTQVAAAKEPAASGASPGGGGFAGMLVGAMRSAAESVATGEAVSMQAIAGQASLNEVVTAVTEAEVALQTVVAVRDKVIQAYNDIIKMPI
jgi:flagellar hook-basal body complex protein FliE